MSHTRINAIFVISAVKVKGSVGFNMKSFALVQTTVPVLHMKIGYVGDF